MAKNTIAVYSLVDLFHTMETGHLVVPAFQRGYVWSREAAKDLFVTVNRGLPIGMLIAIEGASDLFKSAPYEKTLFPKPNEQMPKLENRLWLIDGVQRLATLYNGLFATGNSFELLYHLTRREFFFSEESKKDGPLLRMPSLFDTEELMKLQASFAMREDGEALLAELNDVRDRFYYYQVPTCILMELEKSDIVEVFTSLNTTGTRLTEKERASAMEQSSKEERK
jgi:hypothetical protein